MRRGLTGEFRVSVAGGERIESFVPRRLPPEPPLEVTGKRERLLERGILALGRLDSITLLLPNPDLFLYAYVRREAVLSSQIEGTQSSLSDLLLFELPEAPGAPFHQDVIEVSNYVRAMEHGMARLKGGFPISNRLLREIHAELLSRGRGSDKLPGEFRRSQNWIGGTRPGNAHFLPPPPDAVEACMADLERFIHEEAPSSVLVKAALAHVQFETIHPFLDGNGRVGRLLIALLLHDGGALSQPLLYLSLYFKQQRAEYYRLLDLVRTEGDWEAWLEFFLEGVEATANGAVETARRLVAQFHEDEERVRRLGRGASRALRVLTALREGPLITLTEVRQRTGLTFPTATSGMRALEDLGIAREFTGRRRNRVFAYDRYLGILNEGTEPL